MKRLIFIFVLSLMCVEIAFANDLFISVSGISQVKKSKMRTFSMGGKTVTVNIEETVKDYFQESLNGHWACIPVIIECGAQEYNIAEAQYLLGMSYMEGIDRTKNVDEGMKWLKKSADQYLPEAMGEFGSYCSDFGKRELAEKYLLLAADVPTSWAYYNLGHLYHVEGKLDLAEKYYRLAIENGPKGQVDAIHNLNILLVNQYRLAETVPLLKLGVEKYHDSYCMGTLGYLLYTCWSLCNNNPSQLDKKNAVELFKQGASLGDKRSIDILNKINIK